MNHDKDAIDHLGTPGKLTAMVQAHPWVGLQQGAEEYLRHRAQLPNLHRAEKTRLRSVLAAWDAREQPGEVDEGTSAPDLRQWGAVVDSATRKLASARRKLAAREEEMGQILDSARAAGVPPNVVEAWEIQAGMAPDQHEGTPAPV